MIRWWDATFQDDGVRDNVHVIKTSGCEGKDGWIDGRDDAGGLISSSWTGPDLTCTFSLVIRPSEWLRQRK